MVLKLSSKSRADASPRSRARWEEIARYGQRSAARAGIKTEEDVVKMIHDFRRERRKRSKSLG
jgi:hypothetical protein